MNINDSTKVNLPKKEGNLPENNKPSFKLTKPSENKKGLSKSAKYVIGFAGGIAAGAAGAGQHRMSMHSKTTNWLRTMPKAKFKKYTYMRHTLSMLPPRNQPSQQRPTTVTMLMPM